MPRFSIFTTRDPGGQRPRRVLPVEDTWRVALPQSANGLPTITFLPPAGNDPQVLITACPPKAGTAPQGPELRREAEAAGKKALAQAVERGLALRELRGPQAFGYFYTLTDRAPGPKGAVQSHHASLRAEVGGADRLVEPSTGRRRKGTRKHGRQLTRLHSRLLRECPLLALSGRAMATSQVRFWG